MYRIKQIVFDLVSADAMLRTSNLARGCHDLMNGQSDINTSSVPQLLLWCVETLGLGTRPINTWSAVHRFILAT